MPTRAWMTARWSALEWLPRSRADRSRAKARVAPHPPGRPGRGRRRRPAVQTCHRVWPALGVDAERPGWVALPQPEPRRTPGPPPERRDRAPPRSAPRAPAQRGRRDPVAGAISWVEAERAAALPGQPRHLRFQEEARAPGRPAAARPPRSLQGKPGPQSRPGPARPPRPRPCSPRAPASSTAGLGVCGGAPPAGPLQDRRRLRQRAARPPPAPARARMAQRQGGLPRGRLRRPARASPRPREAPGQALRPLLLRRPVLVRAARRSGGASGTTDARCLRPDAPRTALPRPLPILRSARPRVGVREPRYQRPAGAARAPLQLLGYRRSL